MQTTIAEFKETPQTVQFYSHHAMGLKYSQQYKVLKFLEHNCIEYVGDNQFICKPIPGYNQRQYSLWHQADGSFSCNCQGFQTKLKKEGKGNCSHIGALFEFFSRRKKCKLDLTICPGVKE